MTRRFSVQLYIEVEASDHEAARDLVYAEIDARPSAGTASNPFRYVDEADVYEVDPEPVDDEAAA